MATVTVAAVAVTAVMVAEMTAVMVAVTVAEMTVVMVTVVVEKKQAKAVPSLVL